MAKSIEETIVEFKMQREDLEKKLAAVLGPEVAKQIVERAAIAAMVISRELDAFTEELGHTPISKKDLRTLRQRATKKVEEGDYDALILPRDPKEVGH